MVRLTLLCLYVCYCCLYCYLVFRVSYHGAGFSSFVVTALINIIFLPFSIFISFCLFPLHNLFHARNRDVAIVIGFFTYSTLRDYLHNHASTCNGGQRNLCVWLLLVFASTITYQVFESSRYNLMFSLPSLDSSITHTRDTSGKRRITYTKYFAGFFFYLVDCPVFFFFFCENELFRCFALC